MNITKEEIAHMIPKGLKLGKSFPYVINIHNTVNLPICDYCKERHRGIIIESYDDSTDLFSTSHGNMYTQLSGPPIIIPGKNFDHSSEEIEEFLTQSFKKRGSKVRKARKGVDLSFYLKSKGVSIRFSPEELEILREKADFDNCSVGEFIRRKVFPVDL